MGRMGERHARALEPLAEVIAVDPARGLGPPTGRLDGAVVAVAPQAHLQVALPLLRAGVPCLVEKPLGGTLGAAEALAGFPHLQVGFVERWSPAADVLGRAGDPMSRVVLARRWSRPGPAPHGMDVVRDLLIHDLDLLRWVWREEPVLEAVPVCVGGACGPDVVEARLRGSGGRTAKLVASRVAGARERRWTFGAGERRLEVDLLGGPPEVEDALTRQARGFLAALGGRREFSPGGQDGVAALRLALDLLRVGTARPRGPS
jgi:predicted dehydrogenase